MTEYQEALVDDPNVVLRGGRPEDEGALLRLSGTPDVDIAQSGVTYVNAGEVEYHPEYGPLTVYRPRE